MISTSCGFALSTGAAVSLSSAGGNGPPQVVVASNGNATSVWTAFPNQIVVSTFSATTGAWSGPTVIANGSAPAVAVDQSGNTLLIWVSLNNQIYASRYAVSSQSWSAGVLLSTSGGANSFPRISMNSSGVALIVWLQSLPYQVLATTFNPSTLTFLAPQIFLSNINPASFAIDDNNTGIAVWQSIPSGVIQAARLAVP